MKSSTARQIKDISPLSNRKIDHSVVCPGGRERIKTHSKFQQTQKGVKRELKLRLSSKGKHSRNTDTQEIPDPYQSDAGPQGIKMTMRAPRFGIDDALHFCFINTLKYEIHLTYPKVTPHLRKK